MEIIDYLRIARKRLKLLIVVPLLAGLIVTAFVILTPRTYAATAVVGAPALVGGSVSNQYNGSQGVLQYTAAFQATADSPIVLQKVADATKQPVRDIDENLVSTPIGTSSIMRVTYTTRDAAVADDVVQIAATEVLRYMFGSQVTLAQRRVDEAHADLDRINKELTDLYTAAGSVNPRTAYDTKLQQIANLEERQDDYRAQGLSSAAASIASSISARRAELAKIAPMVTRFDQLQARLETGKTVLVSLQQSLKGAQSQLQAADPAAVVTLTRTHPVDRGPILLQKVAPAIGAGLFLAVGLVILLELLARRRRPEVPLLTAPEDRPSFVSARL